MGVLQKGNISQKTQEKCRPPIVMQLQFIHEVILQRTKQSEMPCDCLFVQYNISSNRNQTVHNKSSPEQCYIVFVLRL